MTNCSKPLLDVLKSYLTANSKLIKKNKYVDPEFELANPDFVISLRGTKRGEKRGIVISPYSLEDDRNYCKISWIGHNNVPDDFVKGDYPMYRMYISNKKAKKLLSWCAAVPVHHQRCDETPLTSSEVLELLPLLGCHLDPMQQLQLELQQ